ncbi:MAG: MBOAT family O-acyltransferase [Muricomes sp.]
MPLGISFITFSAVSYVVDIYRGDSSAGSILDTALYISFFPKVVSGPIVLWKDFQPQIKNRTVNDVQFMDGLNRIMIGYAKKVLLADSFGLMVADIQQKMEAGMDVPTAWWCALLYMLQIYYDFAGYSDIALGFGKLLGFQFKENFHFPYVSASITEFWRRWHISLGAWFREYIYIPLGGNRKGKTRTLVNLFIVFLVTGIWHGAGWNYGLGSNIYSKFNLQPVYLFSILKEKAAYEKTENIYEHLLFHSPVNSCNDVELEGKCGV